MAERNDQFDTSIDIVTPENISFQYEIAGPFQRLPAYLLDRVLCILFLVGLAVVLGCSGLMQFIGIGPWLVAWFLLDWFYGGVLEAIWNGQTLGKRFLRLRVVSTDGSPITPTQAVLRNLLRYADLMPYAPWPLMMGASINLPTLQAGLLTGFITRRYQRLGDLAAGTMVIVEEPQQMYGMVRVMEPEALQLAAEIPPGFRVTRSLSLALSSYVQRRQFLSWQRRAEIAQHLGAPLCERFNLPPSTSHDLLLCALYHKTFVAEGVVIS
jgi:uncharacterized RDD family membrane protein YckC